MPNRSISTQTDAPTPVVIPDVPPLAEKAFQQVGISVESEETNLRGLTETSPTDTLIERISNGVADSFREKLKRESAIPAHYLDGVSDKLKEHVGSLMRDNPDFLRFVGAIAELQPKEKYPGKRSGISPLQWYNEHYKAGVQAGVLNSTDIARDRTFVSSLQRNLKGENSSVGKLVSMDQASGEKLSFRNTVTQLAACIDSICDDRKKPAQNR